MCKQTETMHVDKQLKPEQLKEPIAMYDCGQHLKGNCTENKNLSLYQEYITFIAYNRFPRIETLSKIIGMRNRR